MIVELLNRREVKNIRRRNVRTVSRIGLPNATVTWDHLVKSLRSGPSNSKLAVILPQVVQPISIAIDQKGVPGAVVEICMSYHIPTHTVSTHPTEHKKQPRNSRLRVQPGHHRLQPRQHLRRRAPIRPILRHPHRLAKLLIRPCHVVL